MSTCVRVSEVPELGSGGFDCSGAITSVIIRVVIWVDIEIRCIMEGPLTGGWITNSNLRGWTLVNGLEIPRFHTHACENLMKLARRWRLACILFNFR